jgi:Ni/Co efflux regulator RcnB
MKRTFFVLAAGASFAGAAAQPAQLAAARPVASVQAQMASYPNCRSLNRVYPHGVGRFGARDHTRSGSDPVTNFRRSTRLYLQNRGLDRDKDRIAWEKK